MDSTLLTNTIRHLNSFLRGERSAVQTYQHAMEKLGTSAHSSTLQRCARSHQERAELLAQEVRTRGGEPDAGAGPWGALAKVAESGALALGEKAAISMLEQGEDHGLADYERDLPKLDPQARLFVSSHILPEQIRTHAAMSSLKASL